MTVPPLHGRGRGSQTYSSTNEGRGDARRQARNVLATQISYPKAKKSSAIPRQTTDNTGAYTGGTRGFGADYTPEPGAYSFPSEQKARFAFRQYVKNSGILAPGKDAPNSQMIWTPSESDINLLQQQWDEKKLWNYHQWLLQYVDLREPGRYEHFRSLFPEIIDKQLANMERETDLMNRKKRLNAYGPQERDDFLLLYLLQTGQLQDNHADSDNYIPGWFAPKYARPGANKFLNVMDYNAKDGNPVQGLNNDAGSLWQQFNAVTGTPVPGTIAGAPNNAGRLLLGP